MNIAALITVLFMIFFLILGSVSFQVMEQQKSLDKYNDLLNTTGCKGFVEYITKGNNPFYNVNFTNKNLTIS